MKKIIIVVLILMIGVNLGCNTSHEISQTPSLSPELSFPSTEQVTPENFDKIEVGMTYDEVFEIFECEGFHIRPDVNDEISYKWTHMTVDNEFNVTEYSVYITFKDGKVCYKGLW